MKYKIGERYLIKNLHSRSNGKVGTLVHAGNDLLWLDIDETRDTHKQRIALFEFDTTLTPADVYDEIRNLSKHDLIAFIETVRRTGNPPKNVLDNMKGEKINENVDFPVNTCKYQRFKCDYTDRLCEHATLTGGCNNASAMCRPKELTNI